MLEKELSRIAAALEQMIAIATSEGYGNATTSSSNKTAEPSSNKMAEPPENQTIPDAFQKPSPSKIEPPDLSNTGNFVNYVIGVHGEMEKKGQTDTIANILAEFNYTNVYDVTPEDRLSIWHKLEQKRGNV